MKKVGGFLFVCCFGFFSAQVAVLSEWITHSVALQALPSSITPGHITSPEWSTVHAQPHSAYLELPLLSTGICLPAFPR